MKNIAFLILDLFLPVTQNIMGYKIETLGEVWMMKKRTGGKRRQSEI